MLHCCIFVIIFINCVLILLKSATQNLFRFIVRAMPLIVAALMIAAQTLAASHSVAHANNYRFAAGADRASVQEATNNVSASPLVNNAHNKFWTALFGHSADGADNGSACVAWDAAFAAAALLDNTEQFSAVVVYSVATSLVSTPFPLLTDLLSVALARAPPRI
jgi:hypothetical protein